MCVFYVFTLQIYSKFYNLQVFKTLFLFFFNVLVFFRHYPDTSP